MTFSIPKGVYDILPIKGSHDPWKHPYYWQWLENHIRERAALYNLQEVRTPIFEKTELFYRGVGEETDIVSKEMYTFEDKGKRSLTLRPEGTACVMRSLIENRLCSPSSLVKLFYIAPMFRYERPQAGRFRQHTQFGVEVVGSASPYQDVELIDLLYNLYSQLGLKQLTIKLNCVGSSQCRKAYKEALIHYLQPLAHELSEESQIRLQKNPLRVLDSKSPQDQKALEKAPSILDFLSADSLHHFSQVQKGLSQFNIPFEITPRLVRGLDYYNLTVFEITSSSLGAQNSLGGGGRYDSLIQQLGGPSTPAVGFGTGMERILQALFEQKLEPTLPKTYDIVLIPLGDQAHPVCLDLLTRMRRCGIKASMEFQNRKLKQSMKWAHDEQSSYVMVIGDSEIESDSFKIKHMDSGEDISLKKEDILPWLTKSLDLFSHNSL